MYASSVQSAKPMKAREAKSNGTVGQARNASNSPHASANGDWKDRVQRPRIADPEKRRAAVERATKRIKTDTRVGLTWSRRGR